MRLLRFIDYNSLSDYTAALVARSIKENPRLTLCMASGHTPALTCDLLVKKLLEEKTDCSGLCFLGLDEWVGLPPENEGSCTYFFQTRLIKPLGLRPEQYHLFDALAPDLENECRLMDARIEAAGGIDIMLVGIGMNGHIGFNEPGTPASVPCHVAKLDEVTKQVGQKYFTENRELDRGITIGLGHLRRAKTVLLQANGLKKAEVIRQTIEGPVTENFPASMMQQLDNGFVLADEEAASLVKTAG